MRNAKMVVAPLLLLLTAEATAAWGVEVPSWASHQAMAPMDWPDELVGKVQDEENKPLPGADVRLVINAQIWVVGGIYVKPLHTAETVTDAEGNFRFPTAAFPAVRHRPVSAIVTASASGLVSWRNWWWYGMKDNQAKPKFGTLTLRRGRIISGRCVDDQGNAVPQATLTCYHIGRILGEWGIRHVRTDQRGAFTLVAPDFGDVGIYAYADQHGPGYFRPEPGPRENVEIKLVRGGRVMGFAKTADDKPVPDAVVEAVSVDDGDLPALSAPFRIATRTDAQGLFQLPPLSGAYRVYLTSASAHLADGSHWQAPEPPPMMVPVTIELNDATRKVVILRADTPATASGTITFPDGTPAESSLVKIYQMPDGNGVGFRLGQTVADENGRYSVKFPVPIERLLIGVDIRRYKGKQVRAVARNASDQLRAAGKYGRGDRVTADVTVDFVFSEK